MIGGSVTAHGGGAVTPQFSSPHSPARAGGKLIIIIVDNTNREQFIIAPLLPDCVSTSRVARPDTIIQWWGMRRERGGMVWEEGRDEEGRERGLMRFWWCLSRRGSFKHDHLTGSLVWICPSSTPPSLISDCCHSGEVENCHHQLQPPFHARDTSNVTHGKLSVFNFQILSKHWASSVLKLMTLRPQKPATVCKFQMTNRKCGAMQASLTGTTVTGKGANWVFFYLWLLFWRLLVDSSFKFQLIAAVNHDLCEEWAEASILHNRSGYKSNKAFEARGNIRILHKAMQLLNWLNNLSMLCICLCPAMEDQMQHGVSDLLETGSFWIYPPLIYNKGVGSQHSSDGSRQLTSPS